MGAIAAAVRSRELSPAEVLEVFLGRLEHLEPALHAFCTPTPDKARDEAAALERRLAAGADVGPLAGVPVGIKDMLLTRGIRTTFGSPLLADFVPDADDPVVERLRGAGALCLGKTNVPEFGFSSVGHNPIFPTTTNPWDVERTSGGSSSGSAAAVAAAECAAALGTDRAGSIRIPAAHCGIYGFKPSAGLVPSAGRNDFMTTTGPMTRSVADAALLLSVLVGFDDRDPHSIHSPAIPFGGGGRLDGVRVGVSLDFGYAPVDPIVREAVERSVDVFEALGCAVAEAEIPWSDPWDAFLALAVSGIDLAGLRRQVEARGSEMTPHLVAAVRHDWTAEDLTNANVARLDLFAAMRALMREHDLLLTPTVAVPPFGLDVQGPEKIDGRIVDPLEWIPFTFPMNMTGQPAASLPCGWTDDGLPIGAQLVGRRFEDALVLRASAAFEEASPWADRRPPISVAAPAHEHT